MKVCPRCSEVYPDETGRCPNDGSTLKLVRDPLIGRTVGGRFRLISRLGVGGMSSVYLARHILIDRMMAIKTLRRDLSTDPVQRDRFLREARAVNRVNHSNIVEITDFGETEDGLVYLVMEYVPGESLHRAMRQAPFAALRALHITGQVCSALGRAHQMGVVHRDLKPENILLVERKDDPDFVKVLDFGIAKILDAPSLTGSQQIFGTPGYIAPEYIQSSNIDGRADLYSLGVVLYEMTTGALPFEYEYPGDLLVKHVAEPPIPPSRRLPSVHEDLERFILRCLEKDPAARFRDAYHMLDELERVGESVLVDSATEGGWANLDVKTIVDGRSPPYSGTPGSGRIVRKPGPDGDRPTDRPPPADDRGEESDTDEFAFENGGATPRVGVDADRAAVSHAPTPPGASDSAGSHDEQSSRGRASEGRIGRTISPSPGSTVAPPPAGGAQTPSDSMWPVVDTIPEANMNRGASFNTATYEIPRDGDAIPVDVEIALGAKELEPGAADVAFPKLKELDRRSEAVRKALSQASPSMGIPPEIADASASIMETMAEVEDVLGRMQTKEREVQELNATAREFRSSLGRLLDELGRQLSSAQRDLERLVLRRNELRDREASSRRRHRRGEASEPPTDALLWELATAEAELREKGVECDETEVRLGEIRSELDMRSEEVETKVAALVRALDADVRRLEPMVDSLGHRVEVCEAYVQRIGPRQSQST